MFVSRLFLCLHFIINIFWSKKALADCSLLNMLLIVIPLTDLQMPALIVLQDANLSCFV